MPAVSALAASPTKTVTVGDNFFKPKTVTVNRGTKVTWVWHSFGIPHNVTVKSGPSKFHSRTASEERAPTATLFSHEGHLPHLSARCTRR